MLEFIMMLIIGLLILAIGLYTYKGNINLIHWYNRTKINKGNSKQYSKFMGFGTSIIGISIMLTALLQMIFKLENLYYIIIVGIFVGLMLMLYGQFKYNKGIF